mgnify:FL=1
MHSGQSSAAPLTGNTQWYILPSSMRRLFVETTSFQKRVDKAGQAVLMAIQQAILKTPEAGALVPGTGGLRKLRMADAGRGKGKRGGFRVICSDLPDAERTYLLALYDKAEKADISPDEKKGLRDLVKILKLEAR